MFAMASYSCFVYPTCSVLNRRSTAMGQIVDLTGKRFGRLVVIRFAGIDPKKRASTWDVKCDCGKEFTINSGARLTTGKTKSCGCLQRETVGKLRRKHGHSTGYKQSPIHAVWQAMLRRCLTKTHKHYADYGGRGITVCDRWLPQNNGLLNFIADLGDRPDPKLTIERRDNNLGYSPENCYWGTWVAQGANKRNSRKLEFRGRTEIASEWARITGIPNRTILNRMNQGQPAEQVLRPWSQTQPPEGG
jgi:hypothetical protein